ncbi:MAG: DUF59 domain-containing protein [Calditrichaceae bacterium]|nr:DUF59 domain-containing protein [Calditrichaceae bacterium]MBN2708227.1 DUF59 domain-containing protein [Calditrichaceae bacterium]RQV92250.1 MAG: DUF59 domain-containing protein [Calditrichota bacterium]
MEEINKSELVMERLKSVEHPEIALSMVDLGMILDVVVDKNIARIAIALPAINVPLVVLKAIEKNISDALGTIDLEIQTEYFEMAPDVKEEFFANARAHWKGAI